ncbi:GNAT family N-acetyltransferase [Alicyclobacillus fodiniaquatilis]|uniref:GNAT family N-acetyltransferase n=1 Tax=Alicyclobacillus fodiniaquatilis TaxID=1661150 RepID=A0ABW4JI06_9BACL
MKRLMVNMYRPNSQHIPVVEPPNGFHVRWFQAGDEATWARIEQQAGEFATETAAMERFSRDFPDVGVLADRCLFVENARGEAVGTATAMSGTLDGRHMGRLGWVAVTPAYQGYGLGKWVVSLAMQRIAKSYEEMYLTTQTTSDRAVGIYLHYGFQPFPYGADDKEAWALLAKALGREIALQFG